MRHEGMHRLWTFLHAMVQRVAFGAATTMFMLSGTDVAPGYPALDSMSAMARFPWVWTCVRAVAGDASGLPLVAARRTGEGSARKRNRTFVTDPILELLERPSPGVTGHLLRKQLWVDYLLTGNAYVWRPSENLLYRLHPAHVVPQTSGFETTSYRVFDPDRNEHRVIPGSQILHIRDVSWADDRSMALGESAIRCLHDDLMIELGAKTLAAQQSAQGQPTMMFSTENTLGPQSAADITEKWETAVRERRASFAHGRGIKATPLSWSPKEFEYAERSAVTRDVILAVFEVPPARAGIATANYGTEKQQSRTYWSSVKRRAQAFDDAFSMWAAPGVHIEHDFQDVEALQVSYTERLQRVGSWVALGMTPMDAAKYEGFDDAPLPNVAPAGFTRPTNIDQRPEEPQGDKALGLPLAISAYLSESQPRYVEMAAAAEQGAEMGLALRWETERLFAVLDGAYSGRRVDARWWAGELAAATLEGTRVAKDDSEAFERLFSTERAERLVEHMRRKREAA